MRLQPKGNSSVRILDLRGALTVSTVEGLKRLVGEAAQGDGDEIVLNFESVDRVDSSGLGAIIACYITLHRKKKKLSLVNLNEKTKEIFFYTHLSKVVNIYEGLGEITA
ncbi:MAG: STAS domain-containing protein [Deltaproteobacteria bacterium]|nr:STAS domain-containing protein [Deltaproteobacteria bacterium]MBW2120568.1 STAS domain-containing protein [Deltaproteobacteria bacterium]